MKRRETKNYIHVAAKISKSSTIHPCERSVSCRSKGHFHNFFFFWLIYFFWNLFPSRLRRGGGGPEKIHQLRISRFHYGLESLRLSNGPSQHSTHTHTDGWAKTFTPSFARLGNLKDLEMMMKMDGGDGGSCRRRWRDIQLAPATGPRTDWTGLTNLVVTVEGEQQRGRFIIQSAPSSMSRAGMAPLSFFLLFSWRNVP